MYITDRCLVLLAVFGPVATTWFGILQRHVVLKGTASTTAARVAADQVFFAPVQLTCFLSSMAIMEGVDPVERLKTAFVPAYKANLMVWPFVQGVNFTFVPLELRLLFVNVISLGEYFVSQCCWLYSLLQALTIKQGGTASLA